MASRRGKAFGGAGATACKPSLAGAAVLHSLEVKRIPFVLPLPDASAVDAPGFQVHLESENALPLLRLSWEQVAGAANELVPCPCCCSAVLRRLTDAANSKSEIQVHKFLLEPH